MKLIVTHISPDYDALASLALAKLLHPGAVAVLQGGISKGLEAFVHLYRDQLNLQRLDDIVLDEVEELIVVDSSDPERIAPFDTLLGKVPVTLYDHHPRPEKAIPAVRGRHQTWGATASILSLLLKARGIDIPQAIASLALLGIHDDTGNLSYPLTQPEDYEAAAHLLRCGASLELVQQYIRERYDPEHRKVFVTMLEHAREHRLAGRLVVVSSFSYDNYVAGLAPLCNQLQSFYMADAAFLIIRMEGKTLLIGRSQGFFNIGDVLKTFGGGGHSGAGFAQTDLDIESVKQQLKDRLPHYHRGLRLAKDIMTSPVRTVTEDTSAAEAHSLMMRFGYNGLPVLNADGRVTGIITRRNLDKASQHQLSTAAVKTFMIRKIITATEDSSLRELETLIQTHNIGRLPIMRGDRLVGIVTRTDIIRARHQPDGSLLNLEALISNLPYAARDVLGAARKHARGALYLVGGTVRDLLLGVDIQDLDVTIEGMSAMQLARTLQEELGGEVVSHESFATCTLKLSNGLNLDISTAREEYYQHPGALPQVIPGALPQDLARRDFSLNALAIRLHPEPSQLIDPLAGLADLQAKALRVIHPLSFIEDPTRILRGARLAGRLGLHFSDDTKDLIPAALEPTVLQGVSPGRLRAELELTLAEPRVLPALSQLAKLSVLERIFAMHLPESWLANLDSLRQQETTSPESYLLVLLMSVPDEKLESLLQHFNWPRRYLTQVSRLKSIQQRPELSSPMLNALSPEEKQVVRAFGSSYTEQLHTLELRSNRQILRGKDVLDLGVLPGPAVGRVLARVTEARDEGQVQSFEDELELAKTLVAHMQETS